MAKLGRVALIAMFMTVGSGFIAAGDAPDEGEGNKQFSPIETAMTLFMKITGNDLFTYEDEIRFFGELGADVSILLLEKLGIIDATGDYMVEAPKYSPLGELLRMNAKKFQTPGKAAHMFHGSFCYQLTNTSIPQLKETREYAVTYRQVQFDFPVSPPVKTEFKEEMIINLYFDPDMGIFVFPFYVNGVSVEKILGFEKDEKNELIVSDNTIADIKKRLSELK